MIKKSRGEKCFAPTFPVRMFSTSMSFSISFGISVISIIPCMWLGMMMCSRNMVFGKCAGIAFQYFSAINPSFDSIMPLLSMSPNRHSRSRVQIVMK